MKMFSFTLISAAILLATSAPAQAYIPSSKTIAIRTAKNSGSGAYAIEQDVQFRAGADSLTVRERWVVQDGETMRVSVTGTGKDANVRYDALYRAMKKTAPDSSGNLKTTAVSSEFLEKYAHARTSTELLQTFVRSGIVPASFLQERAPFNPNSKAPRQPEPLVRLGRSNGVITWVFGQVTPANSSKLLPSAWIEQDAFTLRRLRFPSTAEMNANQFALQSGNMMYPRERTVTWNGNTAVIRLTSVKTLTAQQAAAAVNANAISAADAKAIQLPDQAGVREFYSRFR